MQRNAAVILHNVRVALNPVLAECGCQPGRQERHGSPRRASGTASFCSEHRTDDGARLCFQFSAPSALHSERLWNGERAVTPAYPLPAEFPWQEAAGERSMPLPGGCSPLRHEYRAGPAGSGPLLARPTGAHLSRLPRLVFRLSRCRCPRRFPSARLLGALRRPPAAGRRPEERSHRQHPVTRLSESRGAELLRAGPSAAAVWALALPVAAASAQDGGGAAREAGGSWWDAC